MPGTLYITATPIGNLEDITYRAVRTLREVDRIACEDTRHSRKLLNHFAIEKPLVSLHDHNEEGRTEELLRRLGEGESIALISDAGTPLISDPGFRLVRAAAAAGIRIVPIPGASAAIAALCVSGLPTDAFHFGGFLPVKKMQRRKLLEGLRGDETTHIYYEAPHRIRETLDDIHEALGDRPVVVARELTKLHEEILRGTASGIADGLRLRTSIPGEITLVIGKGLGLTPTGEEVPIQEEFDGLLAAGIERMQAMKDIAARRKISKREVYRELC